MIKIEREKPKGKTTKGELKNFAFNSKGQFFLIFDMFDLVKIPAKSMGKKVFVNLNKKSDKELIINLSREETEKLKKFMEKIK